MLCMYVTVCAKYSNKLLKKKFSSAGQQQGRNDGFENVTVLKWESCTRTQSRTRSQI